MVGEVALRWEVLNRSSPEESLGWKKNLDELGVFVSLFCNLPWYNADVQTKSSLTEILSLVEAKLAKRARRSGLRNFLSYIRDPVWIDGMKEKLNVVLSKFQVCLCVLLCYNTHSLRRW